MSSPGGLSFALNQLTVLSGCPTIDALLVTQFANCKSFFLCGVPLTDIYIVDTFMEPDADVAMNIIE